VAAFGLTAVSDLLVGQRRLLGLVGGAFLVYLGLRTIMTRATEAADAPDRPGLLAAYASTVGLTLTNPSTILSFAAVFAGLGLVAGSGASAVALVAGVFIGSGVWWLVLTGGVGLVRERVTPRFLRAVNVLSGVVFVAFGIAALASAVAG
jgi:threonine/homoserine/homoserine lactone efflux protein